MNVFPGRLPLDQGDDGPDLRERLAHHYRRELWVRRDLRHSQPIVHVLQREPRDPHLEVQLDRLHMTHEHDSPEEA